MLRLIKFPTISHKFHRFDKFDSFLIDLKNEELENSWLLACLLGAKISNCTISKIETYHKSLLFWREWNDLTTTETFFENTREDGVSGMPARCAQILFLASATKQNPGHWTTMSSSTCFCIIQECSLLVS